LTTCSYQLADRTRLCGLGGEDVGVTGVDDGHGGATEELTAGGTELDLYYGKRFKSVKVDPPKTLCVLAERASSQGSRVSMSSRAMIKAPSRDMRFFILSFSIGCGGTYVVAGEVVHGSLAEHGVVLELRLAERGGVAGDDDELGLAGAEGLEGGLVTKSDLSGLFLGDSLVGRCLVSNFVGDAHLDSQRQLGVDAVSGLCSLLRCHCDGIWMGELGGGRRSSWSSGC